MTSNNNFSAGLMFPVALLASGLPLQSAPAQDLTSLEIPAADLITKGKFQPTFQSIEQYRTPDWFRDAKFGIWAHWGPQAVPGMGDWYARKMYQQGDPDYEEHLKDYGHPSKKGYKDIIPLWKAEKWNPDALMALYAKAGAKYFVSMAVHHDNFDLWNSKYQPRWNSVRVGPHRDVVGEWGKAAKKYGLRFGVSEHLGASYTWFQTSHGADKTGPLAGVPYDGADPQWQDLYHIPDASMKDGWQTKIPSNHRNWFLRIKDLVDKYHPDLLYSDHGFPFPDDAGLPLLAHFYNSNMAQHGGKLEAVYNCKENPKGPGRWLYDFERSGQNFISPQPWQTDTSVGDWFYRTGDHYKTPSTVIRMLCDIASKNGNLLLNITLRPDGTLPPEARLVVDELGKWMPVNGEAIFGTRPWLAYGEGQALYNALDEGSPVAPSAQDVRFTTKNGALYAIMLGMPAAGRAVIKALATDSPALISGPTKVTMLGYKGALKWQRTMQGLEISLPQQMPSKPVAVFKIEGQKTVAALSDEQFDTWTDNVLSDPSISADDKGEINVIPQMVRLHGQGLRLLKRGNQTVIGFWDNANDWVSWSKIKIEKPGKYQLSATLSSTQDSKFTVSFAGQTFEVKTPSTGDWKRYDTIAVGEIEIDQPGVYRMEMKPNVDWHPINLRSLQILPVP